MNTPIIDPSTLTEEQKEVIRKNYEHLKVERILSARMQGRYEALEWLFGKNFFEKGE